MSKRELIKGTSIYTFSNILIKSGNLLLLPILTRLLTTEQYGIVGTLQPISQILSVVLVCGLYIPQMRIFSSIKDNKEKLGSYLFSVNIFIIIVSIFAFILLTNPLSKRIWSTIFDLRKIDFENIKLFIIVGILGALNLMAVTFYRMKKEYRNIALGSLLSFLINFIFSVIFIYYFKLGAKGRILGILSGSIFVFIIYYTRYVKHFKFKVNYNYLKDALIIGSPMIITGILGNIINYSDRIVLAKFLEFDKVAYYTLAYTGAMVLTVFINAFIDAWTPNFYQKISENKNSLELTNTLEIFIGVLIVISLIGQLFSKELIYLLFPIEYYNATSYLPYLLSAMVLQGFYHYLVLFLHYYKDSKYTPLITLLSAIINLAINILFIPKFGAIVAVLSTIISFSINVIIYFSIIKFKYKINFNYGKLLFLYLLSLNPILVYVLSPKISIYNFIIKLIYLAISLIIIFKILNLKKVLDIVKGKVKLWKN